MKYTNHRGVFAKTKTGLRNKYFAARLVNSVVRYVYRRRGEFMLKKEYVRDGKNQIVASVTSGFEGSYENIVKDEHEQITGTTSDRFHTTRDEHGGLVSTNSS